jgi:hypothetical protein
VADYDTLAAAPASVLNKLDRAVPSLARLKARGEGWDLSAAVTAALRQINHAQSRGVPVDAWFGQIDMVRVDAEKSNPFVLALALLFDKGTQKETQARFELFARLAERRTRGQTTPEERALADKALDAEADRLMREGAATPEDMKADPGEKASPSHNHFE